MAVEFVVDEEAGSHYTSSWKEKQRKVYIEENISWPLAKNFATLFSLSKEKHFGTQSDDALFRMKKFVGLLLGVYGE